MAGSPSEIRVRVIPKRGDLARQIMGRGRQYLKPGVDPIRELIEERAHEDEAEGLRCHGARHRHPPGHLRAAAND